MIQENYHRVNKLLVNKTFKNSALRARTPCTLTLTLPLGSHDVFRETRGDRRKEEKKRIKAASANMIPDSLNEFHVLDIEEPVLA